MFRPVFLFVFASYAALNISDRYFNEMVCTVLVALMFTFLVMQCCKGRWKRSAIRRDLLWRTYEVRIGKGADPPDEDDPDNAVYMQGQSNYDVMCAHSFIGCYTREDAPDVEPRDLMGCLWGKFMQLCCGSLC